jgi:predicted NBD/HSP70 family sugar kinase
MKVLVIDLGGTNVKLLATGQVLPRKFPTGPLFTPDQLVEIVARNTGDWEYEAVSIGFPGPITDGKIAKEPHNLGPGWMDYDLAGQLQKPVKLLNDAAMQALGSYRGGHMLFLGLGTGLGSALVIDGVVAPLELAHLPYKKKMTFEDFVGMRGLLRLGKRKWREAVEDVVHRLQAAMVADTVVIGGGNSKKLKQLPPGALLGDNNNAFQGGFRMWEARR